jgi:predicted protein tyrosine phosphatase
MYDACFKNEGHFMQMAVFQLVQNWLREATEEEVAAATLTMDTELLKVINKCLSPSGREKMKEWLSLVKDENKQRLTESFYNKLLKILVVAFDIDCKLEVIK